MTKVEAENWLVKIDAHKDDDEIAHAIEDKMLWEYVADRAEDGDAIAKILLHVNGIDWEFSDDDEGRQTAIAVLSDPWHPEEG